MSTAFVGTVLLKIYCREFPNPPIVITLIQSIGGLVMTKWCRLLQLMVPLVVWLCEETERAVRAGKYHKSISSTSASAFKKTLLEI